MDFGLFAMASVEVEAQCLTHRQGRTSYLVSEYTSYALDKKF